MCYSWQLFPSSHLLVHMQCGWKDSEAKSRQMQRVQRGRELQCCLEIKNGVQSLARFDYIKSSRYLVKPPEGVYTRDNSKLEDQA